MRTFLLLAALTACDGTEPHAATQPTPSSSPEAVAASVTAPTSTIEPASAIPATTAAVAPGQLTEQDQAFLAATTIDGQSTTLSATLSSRCANCHAGA